MSSEFQGLVDPTTGLVTFSVGTGDVSSPYANLPGGAGDYFSTPDSQANSIRQSMVIEVDAAINWSGGDYEGLAAHWGANGGGRGWVLYSNPTGTLSLYLSPDGSTNYISTSGALGLTKGERATVKAEYDAVAQEVTFSVNGVQIGVAVSSGAGSINDTSYGVTVGWAGVNENPVDGKIYSATVTKGPTAEPYALFDGVAGTYISTPSTAENSVTGSMTIEVDMAVDDWTPSSHMGIVAKYGIVGQRAWVLYLFTDGTLRLYTSSDGTAIVVAASTAATGLTNGTRHTITVTFDAATGDVTFLVDGTQLGSVVTIAQSSLFDSTKEITVGLAGSDGDPLAGIIYSAKIYNGVGAAAPLVVDFDPYPYIQGDDDWFDGTLGSQRAVDGDFNEASNWDQVSFPGEDAGWTVAGGKATKVAGIRGTKINQNAVFVTGVGWSITPNTTYLVTYTVTDYTGVGAFQVRLGDVAARSVIANGTYTDVITTDLSLSGGNHINIVAVLDGMGASFDSISVKQIISGGLWTLQGNAIATSPIDDGLKVNFDPSQSANGGGWVVGQVGPELVTNGDFATDTDWTDYLGGTVGGTIVITGGELVVTQGSNSVWLGAYQTFSTVIGKQYLMSGSMTARPAGGTARLGANNGSNPSSSPNLGYVSMTAVGDYSLLFTATGTTTTMVVANGGAATVTQSFSNLSVKELISGYVWTPHGNVSILNSVAMRALYLDPVAARPFPIYASTGQPIASSGAGGLSWDADNRLRITKTLPRALTRTNLLAGSDITDVANWTVQTGSVLLSYANEEFRAEAELDSAKQIIAIPSTTSIAGKTFTGSVMLKAAAAEDIGKLVTVRCMQLTGGGGDGAVVTVALTADYQLVDTGTFTATGGNSGLRLLIGTWLPAQPAANFYFQYPTLEETTDYPAGVPPMVIPVDVPYATGTVEIEAEAHLPGGIIASGPTQELVVFGLPEVMHQGVALTNEGYIPDSSLNPITASAVVWLNEDSIVGDQVTAWNNLGTGANAYNLTEVVGTAANLTRLPNNAARTTGVDGDYFSTPNSAGDSVTGDIDIRWYGALDAYGNITETLLSKYGSSGARSFRFVINSSKDLGLYLSQDGSATEFYNSNAPVAFANSEQAHLRVTANFATNETTFYTSTDGTNWVQLGAVATITLTSIHAWSYEIDVGGYHTGQNNPSGYTTSAQVYDGINGTLVVDFNPAQYNSGSTWQGALGETWTINGDAFINKTGQDVVNSAGGVGIETLANLLVPTPNTVFVVVKRTAANGANQFIFDNKVDNAIRQVMVLSSAGDYRMNQGLSLDTAGGLVDNDPHVMTAQFNADATSALTVSGGISVVGDAGSSAMYFATLFANMLGGGELTGWIGEFIVFDRALDAAEIALVQDYLEGKWLHVLARDFNDDFSGDF